MIVFSDVPAARTQVTARGGRLVRCPRSLVALLLATAFPALTACDAVPQPPTVPLESNDSELAELIDDLRQSALSLPESAEMRGRLAMAYEVNDFHDEARQTYAQAETLDLGDVRWPYFQAVLMAESGDFESALPILDRALALDETYVPAWLYRGTWLNALGRYAEARVAFAKAHALGATDFADAGVARALIGEQRPADAVAVLEALVEEVPHPQIYRMLGRAYQALGRADDAKIAMARGKDADGPMTWPDPLQRQKWPFEASLGRKLMHAERLLEAGRYQESIEVLEAIRARGVAEDAVFINLSLAYGRGGDTETALAVANEGFAASPDNYRFHNVFAGIYQNDGDEDRALEHLRRSIEAHAAQVWPYERMADLLMKQERFDEALAAVDGALGFGTEQPERLHYTAGLLEGVQERWPQAVARFESATALDAAFTMAYIYLGRCLAEMGRFEEAHGALAWAERLATHPRETASARERLAILEARDDHASPSFNGD